MIILFVLFGVLYGITPGQNEKLLNDIREVIKKSVEETWGELLHGGMEIEKYVKFDDLINPEIMVDHFNSMMEKVDHMKSFAEEYCVSLLSDNRLYARPPFIVKLISICEQYVGNNYEKFRLMKCMYQRRSDILKKYISEGDIEKASEFLALIPSTYSPIQERAFQDTEGEGYGFLEGATTIELTVDCVIDEREVMMIYRELEKSEKYQKNDTPKEDKKSEKDSRLNAIGMLGKKNQEKENDEL